MTKRQRLIQNCQTLYGAARSYDTQTKDWGIHFLTVHIFGRSHHLKNGNEARELARKMNESFKRRTV